MRVIEVRKLDKGFAVYVNTSYDINKLENDKRFQEWTTYYKNHKLFGKEFYFTYIKATVCTEVRKKIYKLLGPAQKEPTVIKDKFDEGPSESFLNRGLNKTHRTRQPKIVKEEFETKKKRRK